jgi:hypothetical protein
VKGDAGWRGFIDFAGKSRRAVQDIEWRDDNQVTFTVDTWMGETRPVVSVDNDKLSGYFLVGNTRYPISGTRLDEVPKGIPPVVPDVANQANLLGGEAALWAENVVAPVLDIRLWPRRLRWRSGCGRRRTSTMSTTCTPACRRWTAGRRCRWGCSSIPSSRCSSRGWRTMPTPAAADPRAGG